MRLIAAFILFVSLAFPAHAQVKPGLEIPEHPKIGLSLSGGGAKGFAHVGVLKVLDSLGVKIDYISGTSMGSIVGGLYAAGYTAKDIEKIILDTDFYTLIANEKTRQETPFFNKSTDKYLLTLPVINGKVSVLPKAISKGQKNIYMLKELFKNVSNVTDFSKLPIPFMCVATNLESGNMEIFEKGDLVGSIMASSAFPSLMDPVKIGDSIYIDGAITVNYPSKPLKAKGIDIVIGVDLSQKLSTRSELNSAIDILNQVIDFGIKKETKNQYHYTDINIHPNLEGMSATSYGDKEAILNAGTVEGEKYIEILNKLPKKEVTLLRAPVNPIYSNVYKIDSLTVVNNHIFNRSYVQGKLALKIPSLQTYGSINKMIDKLYATNNYNLINYDILKHNDSNYYLQLDVQEDNTRTFLKFGLHYDEVFHTGLLVNFTVKRLFFRNAIFSVDGIVGDAPRYYFNYFVDNGYIPGFGLYSSGMNMELKDHNDNAYEQRNWLRNEAYIQSVWKDRYAVGGGLSHDYFERKVNTAKYGESKNSLNPYIFIKSDTQDDKEFPTRGFFLNAEGKIIDILDSEFEKKTIQSRARIVIHLPITKFFTYSLDVFGGFTIGNPADYYYKFGLGGIFEQNIGNMVRFEGYGFGQILSDNLLSASNRLQFRVSKNFFLTGIVNFANHFDEINIENTLKINESAVGVTAGYKSPFGQIKINYSSAVKKGNGMLSVILGHWF